MQDCKDGSGLQLIKFDSVTGGQEIKIFCHSCGILTILAVTVFVSLDNIPLLQSLLRILSS